MTELIKKFRDEHIIILTLLKKVKTEKLSDEERTAYLFTVKSILKNHFNREDEKLYPGLQQMATDSNGAIKTVKEFTVGLDKIGAIITSFFENNVNDLNAIQKSSDFTKIITLLEVRIKKEEKDLYPLYDSLITES